MKLHFIHAWRLLLLWALPISVIAQVNGDFENGFRAPQGINNIYSYQGGSQYDDLPYWEGVLVAPPRLGAYPGYSLGGDYLSTVVGAAPRVNPQGTPDGGVFQPHSGNSCVALRRFPTSGNVADQGIWSPATPIIPGHVYQLDYYVLRRPTSQYAEKIKVIVSKAGAQWDNTTPASTSKDISTQNMPYASVTSPAITDYLNWTHVTGTFTAQTYYTTGPYANTSYFIITYDRPLGTYDLSLYVAPGSYDFSYYAIDDITLTDLTCASTPPLAGPDQTICPNAGATIGQGCSPVGATQQWTVAGSSAVFATTLQTTVTPTSTTTYQLTTTFADGSQSVSQTTVTVFDPNNFAPQVSLSYADDCYGIYTYNITNYNPAYTYTVNIYGGFSGGGVNQRGGKGTFELNRIKKARSGSFDVTVNYAGCGGNSATSPVTTMTFPIFPACRQAVADSESAPAETDTESAVAYPNPVAETLLLPQGVEQATLLNSQGQTVLQAEEARKLDVRNLPAGLYNLRMQQKGNIINQHIEVKH